MAEVRPIDSQTPALLAAMMDLFDQGQASHHAAFPDHFGPADNCAAIACYLREFLKPRNPLRTRYGYAKGLFVKEDLVGYLLYRLNKSTDVFYGKSRWNCHIEDVVIYERARGQGGASALMEALLADLAPLGECAVTGTVWNGNSASEALFASQGFGPVSQSFAKVLR